MIDPFVMLAPIFLLAVVGLLQFVGCSFQPGEAESQTPDPTIAPPAGTYSGPISVALADSDASASIYYTLDGSQPATTAGGSTQQYANPIALSSPTTVKAIALDPNDTASDVVTAPYNFTPIAFQQYQDGFVAAGNSSDTIATSAFNSPVTAGDLMVVWIWYNNNTGQPLQVDSVIDSNSNMNYQRAVGPTAGADADFLGRQQEIWYAIVAVGGSNFTVTANFSAPFSGLKDITGHEFSGANQTAPLLQEAANANTVDTTNATCGPLSSPQGGLVFAAAIFTGNASAGAGFTQMSSESGNVSEYQIPTASGPVAATFSNSAQGWIAQMATFQ
jgi:Chitobiase/beta-hexosaminidase C-terminal domain